MIDKINKLICVNSGDGIYTDELYYTCDSNYKLGYVRVWNGTPLTAETYIGTYNNNRFIEISEYRDMRINEILE